MHNALPLGEILRARTSKGEAGCESCGHEVENMHHMLFSCPFARACWLTSPIPIRTLQLPTNMEECLFGLAQITTDTQWAMAANVMWAIWRSRNDRRYRGDQPGKEGFNRYLQAIQSESMMATAAQLPPTPPQYIDFAHITNPSQGYMCQVDGSWLYAWTGGIGFVFT